MRRSAVSQSSRAVAMSPASAAMRASASRAKTSTWASSLRRASSRIAARRSSAPASPIRGVHGGQQAFAERGLFAAAGGAVPRGRRFERRPRSCVLPERAQDTPEVHPGERGQAHVTGGFGLLDRELQGGGAGVVVAGLALRSPEAGELVRLGLLEPETSRRLRGATRCGRRRRRSGAGCARARRGRLRGGRGATGRRPLQPVLDLIDGVDAARLVAGGDRGSGGEEPVGGLIPRPVEPVVERVAAIGQLQRVAELAVMRHDVGEVVRSSALAGRHR